MAPVLPRVAAFPIVGEKNVLTVIGSGLTIPASVQDDCPLIGREAPEIILPDHLGRRCSLHATIALGRPIILFFFPLAGSPHCTMESCMFRDALGLTPIFSELQAIVIGISQDPPARSRRFVDEHHLGYQILHDEKREAMDAYGVPRTWMGLLDQRCTFVIDPSGIVRSMVQGVFDARGHVKFAEQWLIRFEHELSQRSRRFVPVEQYGEHRRMAGGEEEAEIDESQIGIAYGGINTAIAGGIDAAPRHGAASIAASRSMTKSFSQGRSGRAPITYNGNGLGGGGDQGGDKNLWKNWKVLLQQLSSADDKPPPLVLARAKSKTGSEEVITASSASMKKSGSTRSLSRSRSSSKLKDLAKEVRRPSLTSRKSIDHTAEMAVTKQTLTNGEPVPPIPPLFAVFDELQSAGSVDSNGLPQPVQATRAGKRNDSSSSEHGASVWGTDSSLSSHVSTAATSLLGGSRHSHIVQPISKPAITSEVLMPGDAFDLERGPLPVVIRQTSAAHDLFSAAPIPPPKSGSRRSSSSSRYESAIPSSSSHPPPVAEEISEDMEPLAPFRSSRQPVSRVRGGTEELASNAIMRSPSQQSGFDSGRSTPRAVLPADGSSADQGMRASPSLSNMSDGGPRVRQSSSSSAYQHLHAGQRHHPTPDADGVYRITTPTLADAAKPISRVELEPSLSPPPRSLRLDGQQRNSMEPRLRRPINPPKDGVIANLSRHARQISLNDSPLSNDGNPRFTSNLSRPDAPVDGSPMSTNAALEEEEQADVQIQRVIRRTSLRPDKPTMVDAAQLTTPPRSGNARPTPQGNPLTMPLQHGGMFGHDGPLRDGLDRIIVDPAGQHQHIVEERRPSASSIGTFGRRDSLDSDEDQVASEQERGAEQEEDDNVSVY